jgi:hypothetical protein
MAFMEAKKTTKLDPLELRKRAARLMREHKPAHAAQGLRSGRLPRR